MMKNKTLFFLLGISLLIGCKENKNSQYELYKVNNTEAVLILFPGGANTAVEIQEEFKIVDEAKQNRISLLLMNFNRHLWIDKSQTKNLAQELETIFKENNLERKNIYLGGISIGGNVVLSLSNHLIANNAAIKPQGVFIVDSPIDLFALYESSVFDTKNPALDEDRLEEPKGIINYLQANFGSEEELLKNIQEISPFTLKSEYINVPDLKNCKLRFYTEPDEKWWLENRQTNYKYTNAFTIKQLSNLLKKKKWTNFELIETKDKGYRSNGDRHPHSWSIVNKRELFQWIKK